MSTAQADYFAIAVRQARAARDHVAHITGPYESCCVVGLTVLGPDMVKRVPCGELRMARVDADEFERGTLTLTARDTGDIVRTYRPGQWTEATVFDTWGHIEYSLMPGRTA